MTVSFHNDQPDEFLSILHEVGQWLTDSGHELWQPNALTAENLFDDYTLDNCYVMSVGETPAAGVPAVETPAATFILQWKDPLYYANVPDHTAGFIHKVAIRRQFAGQGLFAHVLDFCREQCRERGIYELQLETDATRPALMHFYERHGFLPVYQKSIHEFGQSFLCQYYVLRFS
ncbi:MAG: GNAT family N-acetyltransferase [Spirosoma sp.]|nr:GNAT family N-acetyltransferase [Spirosoma sp.]